MKSASISEIKNELQTLAQPELQALCLRLAKYKKENKELLDFLLFHAHDVQAYISQAKTEMEEGFKLVNTNSVFFAKKTIRKNLRIANKYIKYTQDKTVEIELLFCFCQLLKKTKLLERNKNLLHNMYDAQVKKIKAAWATLHEDEQYDYKRMLEEL